MPDIPKHLDDRNDWSVEDHISYARTGDLPVNPAYKLARNKALEDAGLDPDQDIGETAVEDMTTEQHFERIRRN